MHKVYVLCKALDVSFISGVEKRTLVNNVGTCEWELQRVIWGTELPWRVVKTITCIYKAEAFLSGADCEMIEEIRNHWDDIIIWQFRE
jgi:hypothetical protein